MDKQKQKDFFQLLRKTYPIQFKDFFEDYFKWKREEQYKAYRGICPNMNDSEAKAMATEIRGYINAIEDILKQLDV